MIEEQSIKISDRIRLHIVSVVSTNRGRKAVIRVDSGIHHDGWWMDYYPDSIHPAVKEHGWGEYRGGLLIRVCRGFISKDKPSFDGVKADIFAHVKNMRAGIISYFNGSIVDILSIIGSMEWHPIESLSSEYPKQVFIASFDTKAVCLAMYDPNQNRVIEIHHLNDHCPDTFPEQWSHYRTIEDALRIPKIED